MALWEEFNNIDVRDYESRHPALFAYVKEQMARPGKQYLLVGDTNHMSAPLIEFLNSPAFAALLKHAGIENVCIEKYREEIPPRNFEEYKQALEDWRAGNIRDKDLTRAGNHFLSDGTYKNFLQRPLTKKIWQALWPVQDSALTTIAVNKFLKGGMTLGLTHAGFNVAAVDSKQWGMVDGKVDVRLFLGDREVADRIREQAHDNRTAVIYGAAHYARHDSIQGYLDPERTVRIDVYESKESYLADVRLIPTLHKDEVMPDRIYFVEDDLLAEPNPARHLWQDDESNPDAQNRQKIINSFGAAADPEAKAAALTTFEQRPYIDKDYFTYKPPKNGPA